MPDSKFPKIDFTFSGYVCGATIGLFPYLTPTIIVKMVRQNSMIMTNRSKDR